MVDSDLFRPSLQDHDPQREAKPWRLSSQMFVAFFGGTMSIAIIAAINARRLRCPPRVVRGVTGFLYIATVLDLLTRILLARGMIPIEMEPSTARLGLRIFALLVYVGARNAQVPYDRIYSRGEEGEYASLWVPGILAMIASAAGGGAVVFLGVIL